MGNKEHADVSSELLVIKPSQGWVPIRLSELWNYRDLLYFLVWRDVKVRYKQTVLGAGWAVLADADAKRTRIRANADILTISS